MTLALELAKSEPNLSFLFEIELEKRLDNNLWTQCGSPNDHIYWIDHTSAGYPSRVRGYVIATGAISTYTEKTSIVNCQAAGGSWFYDTATKYLYVHPSGAGSPSLAAGLYLIASHFWRYFCDGQLAAPKELIFNNNWYDPRLAKDSIPDVTLAVNDISQGGISQTWGNIKLENGDGYFDSLLDEFIWHNRLYYLRIGVPGEAYSEFKIISRGRTGSIEWSNDNFSIATEDQMMSEE